MSRPARGLALLLATVLLLAPVVPFAAVGGAAAAPAGMSTIPDANVADDVPAGETIPLSAAELEGGVMASQHADSLSVTLTTADHAASVMDADSAVVSGDGMAVVLRDDQQSAGREVALDAGLLQQALGYKPQAIYGTHEDGSEWTASAEYVDGYLVFDVPHFSSNTVTFSGEVTVTGQNVDNNTQFTYSVDNETTISNVDLSIEGTVSQNTENTSFPKFNTANKSVGGNREATVEATLTLPTYKVEDTGHDVDSAITAADFDSGNLGDSSAEVAFKSSDGNLKILDDGTLTDSGSTIDGSEGYLQPGDTDGDGSLEVVYSDGSIKSYDYTDDAVADSGVGSAAAKIAVADTNGDGKEQVHYMSGGYEGSGGRTYNHVTIPSQNNHDTSNYIGYSARLRAADTNGDGSETVFVEYVGNSYQGGTDGLKEYPGLGWVQDWGGSDWSVRVAGDITGDGTEEVISGPGKVYSETENDGSNDINGERIAPDSINKAIIDDVTNDGTNELLYADGNNRLKVYDYQEQQTTDLGYVATNGVAIGDVTNNGQNDIIFGDSNGNLKILTENTESTEVNIDTNGDGVFDTSTTIQPGADALETWTTPPGSELEIVSSTAAIEADLTIAERTATTDPEVQIDSQKGNQTVTHSGVLSDGETIDLGSQVNGSSLGGETTLTVRLASVPGVDPTANINYTHTAQKKVRQTFQSTAFEESYNVSTTYSEAARNARVVIPFDSNNVVAIKSAEYRTNGGSWQPIGPGDRRMDGSKATLLVGSAAGGVDPGQTVDVRVTGRKISVEDGSVTITDATRPGEELDTELRVDSMGPDFFINVGPAAVGDRVHYAYAQQYATDDYVIINSDGDQDLYLPNTVSGDTFRVRHTDTRVVAERGDVRIDVVKTGENPELDVSPGPGGSGDPVTVEYYNTETGVKYLLNSLTRSIVVDSDVAESPAIFEDDDSEDTWAILRDSGPTGSSGGGGAVGQFRETASNTVGSISLPIGGSGLGQLALVGVLGLGGLLVLRRFNPFGGSSDSAAVTSSTSTRSASGSAVSRLTGLASTAGAVGSRAAQTTGSGVLAALRRLLAYFGQVATLILGNRRASITAGVVAAIVAARVGLVSLPEGTGILIVVAGVPVATWLILRQNNAASTRVWLGSTIAAVILGLEFVAPGTVQTAIEQLTSETVAPLLILVAAGGLYLWYRARQSDRPQIIIGGDSE